MTIRPYTHPGEILVEEFVKPYGLTQKQLCEKLNVGIKTISEIYNKKRAISPVMAHKLANLFGTTAEFCGSGQNVFVVGCYRAGRCRKKSTGTGIFEKKPSGFLWIFPELRSGSGRSTSFSAFQ